MDHSERGRFQLWEYQVSHRQMLLRRPADGRHGQNSDFVFRDVEVLALPTVMTDVRVRSGTRADLLRARGALGDGVGLDGLFVVESSDHENGYVVAGDVHHTSNDLELSESGLEHFSDP